jgi:hypothetical protein
MMMDTQAYADELIGVIDEQLYCVNANDIGTVLNDRIWLALKGKMMEMGVEISSNYRLKRVDQIGYDHIDTKYGYKIEFKFASYSMVSEHGKPVKTTRIRIKNSRGSNKGINIENPADFYLIGQENAMAIISGKDLMPCLEATGDGIDAIIPHAKLTFLFKNVDIFNIQPLGFLEKIEKVIVEHFGELILSVRKREESNATKQG